MYSRATSYASLDWSAQSSQDPENIAVFLEAEGMLIGLRLRVAVENEEAKYTPVVFFAAKATVASEFQLTAKKVAGFALLALALLQNTYMVESHISANVDGTNMYPIALWTGEHIVVAVQSTIEANGGKVLNRIMYV